MKSTVIAAALVTIPVMISSPAQAQERDGRYTAPRNATVSASGARAVEIEAHAGFLHIAGRAGISEVRVRGTARASRESWLEDIKLKTERRGDVVSIVVDIPDMDSNWRGGERALDLEIEVPATIALDIEDGSGETTIRGTGPVQIEDGSGELELTDIGGSVRVHDGSGELTIRNVRGDVRVADGSGEITIDRVTGEVEIEDDGSGSIDILHVTKGVRIGSDGSGSISVDDVGGDFVVERDGSGGVEYTAVKGKVDVPRRHRGNRRDG
jgi:hypothetical protein